MRKVKASKPGTARRRKAARASRPPRPAKTRADAVEAALAALAHEVRTPLNGILALSELIATADIPERERNWAMAVASAADHLAHLTTLIVDGVRANARGLVLANAAFQLRPLVDTMATTLIARAEAKGLETVVTIAADLPDTIVGDQVRLRAALENLIDNAVKFTDHGRVVLSVSARVMNRKGKSRVRLTFSMEDSGIGLTPAYIRRLFRPFAQANAAVGRRYGGAGLGLVFVKRVARAMGGDLTVKSRAGSGSTFQLTIAAEQVTRSAGSTSVRESAADAQPALRSLRILCAEDNPYARVVLKTILTELGHRVDFAGSSAAGLAALGRDSYDLVLMDITLPDIDGLETTRRIRALHGVVSRIPIVGISGRTEPGLEAAAQAAGMAGYLAKPVSPAALAQLLRSLRL